MDDSGDQRRPLWTLFVVCTGVLMIGLDTTVVTVALPSIVADLHAEHLSLSWIYNAYLLSFGGLLVVAGRLGDLYGRRRAFLWGIGTFTASSLFCGIAHNLFSLVLFRAFQGVGAALVSAVSLSLISGLFEEPRKRTWALGCYGLVGAVGGAIGDVMGGVVTGILNWHWVFLVNVVPGLGLIVLGLTLLQIDRPECQRDRLDALGALLLTSLSLLLVYVIVNGNEIGWDSWQTFTGCCGVILLTGAFYRKERRSWAPLIPRYLYGLQGFTAASLVGALFTAATFGWFVDSALYLQNALGYSAIKVGLSYLPAEVITAAFAGGFSTRVIGRFGIRSPLFIGLLAVAAGFALFGRDPRGGYGLDLLPGIVLMGLGAGLAYTPLLLLAMNEVPESDSGIVSGVLNMAFMLGGAIGVALISNAIGTHTILPPAHDLHTAISSALSYRRGFVICSALIIGALIFALAALRGHPRHSALAIVPVPRDESVH